MTNPIEQMLLAGSTGPRFPANSRYHTTQTAELTRADGRVVPYLRRRFAPQPDSLALREMYRVQEGDRLDNLASTLLGDPVLYWRICDANAALRPDTLTETVGRTLRITEPEGTPGLTRG